MEEKLCR